MSLKVFALPSRSRLLFLLPVLYLIRPGCRSVIATASRALDVVRASAESALDGRISRHKLFVALFLHCCSNMGAQKVQKRAKKFVQGLARQLCSDGSWTISSLVPTHSSLLKAAIESVPQGPLKSALESDFDSFVALLQKEIQNAAVPPSSDTEAKKPLVVVGPLETQNLEALLEVARGPLLTDYQYARAVKAAVIASEREADRGLLGMEWREAMARLLRSRSHPPLQLWCAFAALEKSSDSLVEESQNGLLDGMAATARARCLLSSFQALTAASIDAFAVIGSLAPVLCIIFEAVISLSKRDMGTSDKKRRKALREVKNLISDLSGFISLCHDRKRNFNGLSLGPPVAKKLALVDGLAPSHSLLSSLLLFATTGMKKAVSEIATDPLELARTLTEIVEIQVGLLILAVEVVDHQNGSKKQGGFNRKKQELELKLRHNIARVPYSLYSSGLFLDMLLDSCLPLSNILDAEEEATLRGVLYESLLVEPLHLGLLNRITTATVSEQALGKDSIIFLKRIAVTRQAAAFFKSQNEHHRGSAIMEKVQLQSAPLQLGRWLSGRKHLNQLPPTTILLDSRALTGWLLNANNEVFRLVLDEATMQSLPMEQILDAPHSDAQSEMVAADESQETMFFLDTKGGAEGEGLAADVAIDQAFSQAAERMRRGDEHTEINKGNGVLFQRFEQANLKRSRDSAIGSESEDLSEDLSEDSDVDNMELDFKPEGKRNKIPRKAEQDLQLDRDEDVGELETEGNTEVDTYSSMAENQNDAMGSVSIITTKN